MIIELLSPPGQRRYVFDNGKATIGRSYSNDIILDDSFVSPEHLSISSNEKFIYVTDRASVNGTHLKEGIVLKNQSAKFESGDEISIGKTKLKLLLPGHPVQPTRIMDRMTPVRQFFDRRSMAIGFSLLAMLLFNWMTYLEEPTGKFWQKEIFFVGIVYLIIAAIYAGILGLISYFKIHKVYFKAHLAVFNAATVLSFIYFMIDPFLYFWILENNVVVILDTVINFGIMFLMLWASMSLIKDFLTRGDIVKLMVISLLLNVPNLFVDGGFQFGFSGKPTYQTRMTPYLKPLSEPLSLDAFLKKSGHKLFKPADS